MLLMASPAGSVMFGGLDEPISVPLRLAAGDADAMHHAVTEEPVIGSSGDRIRSGAHIGASEFGRNRALDAKVEVGSFVEHRCPVVAQVPRGTRAHSLVDAHSANVTAPCRCNLLHVRKFRSTCVTSMMLGTVSPVPSKPTCSNDGPKRRKPGRPRAGTLVADRSEVIAAAVELIRSNGPDVTMDEVADAAGVSKPIVYRNLGDKLALVIALSEIFVERLNDVVERAVVATPHGRASFASGVRAALELIDEDRNLFLFVTAGGPGTGTVQRLVERSSARMIEQFSAMRIAHGVDPAPARTWAYATVGAIQIVAMMWLRNGDRTSDEVTEDLTELMWPGITGARLRNEAPGRPSTA